MVRSVIFLFPHSERVEVVQSEEVAVFRVIPRDDIAVLVNVAHPCCQICQLLELRRKLDMRMTDRTAPVSARTFELSMQMSAKSPPELVLGTLGIAKD